ncbi:hypothetical protein [Neorhizobium galegae]|uniref:Uncharacterized protein n=1 Tax=Neorhizobium galegae bv. orientalis str. HAMBI 540 TaxID=1028800 RepID=A0A068T2N4_NEOGA|nr:hypothetical protein [Neorhizobium galegae]UIK09019.1 hypothetical protein LZK81_28935 [Neorhizobium galegae]CDN51735.1 Hypothetical protein RG540_PA10590 [Neorhizobium galegae bv. orientalis str. HAMBI 540]CDZ55688.1 Hypothetical protein NGAL_HAMBI2427_63300 [Neorhizobium galegae bv. orientalis]
MTALLKVFWRLLRDLAKLVNGVRRILDMLIVRALPVLPDQPRNGLS